ncbi:MAG: methyl-accepting chemotaxis protein [Deltaproteobacteria bacterium]|nr:methyl-accepting chemotaxis protein [Deltaproteobacteria bacterium]
MSSFGHTNDGIGVTSSGAKHTLLITLIIVGAPLGVALILTKIWFSVFIGANAPPEVLHIAEQLDSWFFWTFFFASIAAVALLHWRNRGISESSLGLTAIIAHLRRGRLQEAITVGIQNGVLPPEIENALTSITPSQDKIKRLVNEPRRSLEAMSMSLTPLSEGLSQQSASVQEISRSLTERLVFHKELSENLDGLSHSAEESSSSVLQMVAINNEVRENIHNLSMSVQETTTAIEEMTFSSKEVAKNIEELSTAAEETAASMNQMDVSISQVETNATETSKLSETVTKDAETGVAAINRTIEGIDKIKESSRVAADVISSLGQKISKIGNILNVIDDVAEQTNLLALNAAIIAAQAGEHGRGFAVVADEIKALAERTGASTKEIAELIKGVQDESKNAVSVMSKGVDDVEEGVRLGHDAESALRKIVDSAKRSTLMIQAIAQATVEQAKGSKQVTNAIGHIAATVQQIAFATAEQAKGSEQIMQSAERMKIITQQVERSADEQNRGGRQVTEAIENIREKVERITIAAREQTQDNERVATASTQLFNASERALESSHQIEKLLGQTSSHLDDLVSTVSN